LTEKEVWKELAWLIPSYNTKMQHFIDCVKSIEDNSMLPGIVLIGNDHSTNNETLACYEMFKTIETPLNIEIIETSEKSLGAGKICNELFDRAKELGYKLVRYMGSDDILHPELIKISKYIWDNRDMVINSMGKEQLDFIEGKEFGGIQTLHRVWFEKFDKFVDKKTASHPILYIEYWKKAGNRFEEEKVRNLDGPLLQAYYEKYFCLTTENFHGEIYRIHDSNISHDSKGNWYGDIEKGTENDYTLTPYAHKKRLRGIRDHFLNRTEKPTYRKGNRKVKLCLDQ